MKNSITMMALAAMLFCACSKEEGTTDAADRTVRINPTIANPALTPSGKSTRATDTDFELGDRVGLRVTMNADGSQFVDNKLMSFDGTDFKTDGFLWYEDVNATSTLLAYYPYVEGAAIPTEFSVLADQGGANYTASDLIVAVKTGVKPTKSATAMTFKHKMARIVIRVTNESGFNVTGIVVKGAAGTGVLDPETGAFAVKEGAEALDVTANKASETVYYALLVPQNGVKLEVTVSTADGKKRTQTLGVTDLKSGENRGMDCNVQEADIQVKFTGAIAGWEDGDELLPDGEGTIEVPTVEWGGVKYKIITLKDGRTWMAENLRYVPEGKNVEKNFANDGDGIWYPIVAVYDSSSSKYAGAVSTETSAVESNGYLYSLAAAMKVDAITEENSATFEGKQGICPDGWHIPTKTEFDALIAAYPIPDNASKASTADLQAAGFSCTLTGMRMKNTSAATGAISGACYEDHIMAGYLMSSTKNSFSVNASTQAITSQNKCLMIMSNATNQNALISNMSNFGGCPVRCIKNID